MIWCRYFLPSRWRLSLYRDTDTFGLLSCLHLMRVIVTLFFRLKPRTIIYFRTQASLVCVGNYVVREQNRGKFYVCKIVHSSIADTPRRWKWHQTSRFPRCRVLWLRRWKGKTLVTAFVHIVRAAWRAPPRYHFIFRCQNILLVKFYSRCSLIKCSLYNKESSSSLSLSAIFHLQLYRIRRTLRRTWAMASV